MPTINASLPDLHYILAGFGIVAGIFSVYSYFRNPQIKSDKVEALMKLAMQNMAERFEDKLKIQSDMITNLRDNHIHTLDGKMELLRSEMANNNIEIAKLATIINERIPKKNA